MGEFYGWTWPLYLYPQTLREPGAEGLSGERELGTLDTHGMGPLAVVPADLARELYEALHEMAGGSRFVDVDGALPALARYEREVGVDWNDPEKHRKILSEWHGSTEAVGEDN